MYNSDAKLRNSERITAIFTLFLRFFIKKLHFFLQIPKKVVPLHPHFEIATPHSAPLGQRNAPAKFGVWCNGNTADSGPAFPGSSPGTPTK